jgi:hypothetical protein
MDSWAYCPHLTCLITFFIFFLSVAEFRNWMETYTQWLQHTRAPYFHSTLLVSTFELLGSSLLLHICASCKSILSNVLVVSCNLDETVRRFWQAAACFTDGHADGPLDRYLVQRWTLMPRECHCLSILFDSIRCPTMRPFQFSTLVLVRRDL